MDAGTVLFFTNGGAEWSDAAELLSVQYGYKVFTARTHAEAAAAIETAHVDFVVADIEGARGQGGLDLLTKLRISHPDIMRVLVVGAKSGLPRAEIARAALYQFLRRPLDAEQLGLVVERGLETRELARRHRLLAREFKVAGNSSLLASRPLNPARPGSQKFEKLVYVSEVMAELCELARKAAKTNMPILIQGETGTGKELLARAIHHNSARRAMPLMSQNCGGMPEEAIHSELFGHKRGAFAGAISDRLGLFRAADGGTVFLDEISEVSPSFQLSLLRFLEGGEVKPLGADETVHCDVRIIAASNYPLKALVEQGKFRKDLYFRLKGFEFDVPPLRARPDDIPVLAEFFAAKHADASGRKILGISAGALEKLSGFDFPGNVRELENEIQRLVSLARDGEYLTTQNLSAAILAAPPRRSIGPSQRLLIEGDTLKDKVEHVERHFVLEALTRHRWNQSRAADDLGLSRVGLANKIKRYGLDAAH